MFICTENKFSDFVVLNSSLDKLQKPNTVVHLFKGTIKNNTPNIYKSVTLTAELIFVLENGKELSCKDISYTRSLLGGSIPEFRSDWKPNEEWTIGKIETCSFDVEYFDYPVKEVYTQYYMKLEDQINNSEKEIMVSQRDVTEKWLRAKKKATSNIVDCSDYEINKYISKF
jgi:hypothetical protein